ncbi:hypothetical protein HELRODRAFT_163188 [Helobdella robusta]|uniref:Uncharacterized protein n=1 Tax=Helobdella robusta TaxID=6412 RepID=T1ETS3_HELRO|nr:hypothetical protein HELRODRAFT_163188 [Helobdella robusta]ESN96156.1 hypothetical protein HELRODRAFT_163188 [Helobdella robusta]
MYYTDPSLTSSGIPFYLPPSVNNFSTGRPPYPYPSAATYGPYNSSLQDQYPVGELNISMAETRVNSTEPKFDNNNNNHHHHHNNNNNNDNNNNVKGSTEHRNVNDFEVYKYKYINTNNTKINFI